MRICYLAHNPSKDAGYGIDRYSFEIIERIRRKHEVIVAQQGSLTSGLEWIVKELLLPARVIGVKASVYHALSQQASKAGILTRKRPLVTTIHDLNPFRGSLTSFYNRESTLRNKVNFEYMKASTLLAARSDMIIAPFEITRKDLLLTLGIPSHRIRVIHYGVNTEFFKPLNVGRIGLGKTKVILFVGGCSKAKGTDVLMRAVATVARHFEKCELWIVGKWNLFDGVHLARELGIPHLVRFLGHVAEDKLPFYYNIADLVVLPSRIGFSLSILEAMACMKPVITSRTPDTEELVGNAASLVDPTNVTELADRIVDLLSNERMRNSLASLGLSKSRILSWEKVAIETTRVYAELMGRDVH